MSGIEWTVSWEIQVTASSAEEAARKALAIQRNPGSTATVFAVSVFEEAPDQAVQVDCQGTQVVLRDFAARVLAQP